MSLESFEYSKTWRSADDFPTIETDEAQVRDDIQCLYDEIAAGLNALITELNSGGVDTAQLADGAVTTDKLADGAVTTAKLADDAVVFRVPRNPTADDITALNAEITSGKRVILCTNESGLDARFIKKVSNQYFFSCVYNNRIYTSVLTFGAGHGTWGEIVWDAYQKPNTGIPSTDLASAVQTSLGKADTAYQKPGTGIPKTDLASAVQASLAKADTALQSAHEVPSGGTSGQVLAKASGTDYDVAWVNQSGGGSGLPSGGSTGQALVKASATDYDVEWADMRDVYWATYDDTTTFTLGTKFSGARFVACKYGDRDYILTEKVSSTDYIFTAVDNGKVYWLENNNDTWTNGSFDIPSLATATPSALGTAAVGSSTKAAKEDHVHAMPSASDVGAVAVAQGVGHAGEFLVVGSDGNVTTVTMTAWSAGTY